MTLLIELLAQNPIGIAVLAAMAIGLVAVLGRMYYWPKPEPLSKPDPHRPESLSGTEGWSYSTRHSVREAKPAPTYPKLDPRG